MLSRTKLTIAALIAATAFFGAGALAAWSVLR